VKSLSKAHTQVKPLQEKKTTTKALLYENDSAFDVSIRDIDRSEELKKALLVSNPVDMEIQECFQGLYRKLSRRQRKVLNVLIWFAYKYGKDKVFPSQTLIGAMGGEYCREHVCRGVLKLFERLGLVRVVNRGVKKTCLYEINELLFISPVARELCGVLPALKFFVILAGTMLVSQPAVAMVEERNVTQLNLGSNLYKYNESRVEKEAIKIQQKDREGERSDILERIRTYEYKIFEITDESTRKLYQVTIAGLQKRLDAL
jgi:hypothetical protein